MNDQIYRRGPDGEGILFEKPVGLAMRRLAIIDLAGGQQPIYNEDGTVGVVFNGEIYNYRELRTTLEARGHRFSTNSDTEVLVHLYEDHGDRLTNFLRGMFAFALWDRKTDRVLLARDRLGIKPLYIAQTSDGILFGSEIKSLISTGLISDEIDTQALDQFLAYTNVPVPRTIYRGISKLPPATIATASSSGSLVTERYWSIPREALPGRSETEWLTACEQGLMDAVQNHLVSDVPVGAFLSGGVDSGIMVALMAQAMDRPVDAFTVGFADSGGSFIDERQYARALAKRYNVRHHEIDVAPNVEEIIYEVVEAFDEPFADDSVIPSYYVSKVAAQHVKVALTGLGGDELFAGYRRHLGLVLGDWYARLPAWAGTHVLGRLIRHLPESAHSSDLADHLKRFVRGSSLPTALRYQDSLSSLPWSERRLLYSGDVGSIIDPDATDSVVTNLFEEARGADALDSALRTDLSNYLVDDILTLTDRLSMWHSLELRVPFLDHPFVELAARIPSRMKIRGLTQKHLLKQLAEKWLPREMIYHKKQGFEAPMGRWLRGPLLGFFDSIVNERNVERTGCLSYGAVRALRDEHVNLKRKNSKILFSILMFVLWSQRSTAARLV